MAPQEQDNQGITRRTLAKGASWSLPIVAASAAAPAFAASPCDGACYTYRYSQHSVGTNANGLQGTATSSVCSRNATMTTAVVRGGRASSAETNNSTGLHSSTYNGFIHHRGEAWGYPARSSGTAIRGLSATSPGLVLNTGYNTTTSVTFTFPAPVRSASVTMVDITRSTNSISSNGYRYQDNVTINQPWTMTGDLNHANRSTGAAGVTFNRTASYESSADPVIKVNTMSTNATAPFTSLTLSYSAPISQGWQFIGITGVNFCFV